MYLRAKHFRTVTARWTCTVAAMLAASGCDGNVTGPPDISASGAGLSVDLLYHGKPVSSVLGFAPDARVWVSNWGIGGRLPIYQVMSAGTHRANIPCANPPVPPVFRVVVVCVHHT